MELAVDANLSIYSDFSLEHKGKLSNEHLIFIDTKRQNCNILLQEETPQRKNYDLQLSTSLR